MTEPTQLVELLKRDADLLKAMPKPSPTQMQRLSKLAAERGWKTE